MKIMFLGQQGWLLSEEETHLLVDPILSDHFGNSNSLKFQIYPPRNSINQDSLPNISAIILTNEHLDHFHIPSIKLISRSVPVIIGRYTPQCIIDILDEEKFKIIICENGESIKIGNFEIKLFIGNMDTPFWERRVYHPYITNQLNINERVLIQSDTLVSDHFKNLVKNLTEKSPTIFISTNNSQITEKGHWGAFNNLYQLNSDEDNINIFFRLLKSVCDEFYKELPDVQFVFFSGTGYIIDRPNSLPFKFSNTKDIALFANELSCGINFIGLYPGEIADMANNPPLISFSQKIKTNQLLLEKHQLLHLESNQNHYYPLESPLFGHYEHQSDIENDLNLVKNEHPFLAKMIIVSKFGKLLLSTNQFINGPINHERFIIKYIISKEHAKTFVLDLNTISFREIESDDETFFKFPFGVEVFLKDFYELLNGKIQIWELATSNLRQWYLGDFLCSPVAFLFNYFSEQIRPDLAKLLYKKHVHS